ncbi:MAG TPA: glycosyl hydrolase, partial [Planctomycetes bacterium]|nr:glycosyl hydrolase [Planctomycetota bacterium]
MNPGTRIWVGIPGLDLDGETARHLEELRPGGVILFGRNFRDPVQLGELIVALR